MKKKNRHRKKMVEAFLDVSLWGFVVLGYLGIWWFIAYASLGGF